MRIMIEPQSLPAPDRRHRTLTAALRKAALGAALGCAAAGPAAAAPPEADAPPPEVLPQFPDPFSDQFSSPLPGQLPAQLPAQSEATAPLPELDIPAPATHGAARPDDSGVESGVDLGADPATDPGADPLAARERELGAIEARIEAVHEALADRVQVRDALLDELAQYELDISSLTIAGRQLERMIGEHRIGLAALQTRQAAAQEELAAARQEFAALVRAAYALGRGDRLRLLLNQEDPTRTGRIFGYYHSLGRDRAEAIAAIERLGVELSEIATEAATEAERLTRLAAHQEQTRLRLEAAHASREAIVSGIERAIVGDRERVAALAADAAALRELIEQLRRRAEIAAEVTLTQEAIAARRGRLPWPLPEAEVLQGFRAGGAGNLHANGVLLAAREGSEVRAVHHGRVVYADWLRGFGLLLVIDHGDGYMTLYGHNESLLTEVGEWVASGDVIALTGTSGGSGHRGLYFAIRRHDEALDPQQWCSEGAG